MSLFLRESILDKVKMVIYENVVQPVLDAQKILGDKDMKRALACAAADPYEDKRMAPTIAKWLKNKIIQAPNEHKHDIEQFKIMRPKLKDLRVPITNPERKSRIKELLQFNPVNVNHPSQIESWNREVSYILDPNKDLSDSGLKVVGKHNGYTMYKIDRQEECQIPIVKNTMSWCITKQFFGEYGGPPYYPVVRDSDKSPFAMILPNYFDEDPDQAVRNSTNTDRLSIQDLNKIRPLVQKVLPKNKYYGNSSMYHNTIHGIKQKLPDKVPKDFYKIISTIKDLGISIDDWPAAKHEIIIDPAWAYLYARTILDKPFPNGEDAMASYSTYAYNYARYVLKAPFPKGEDAISKDAQKSYEYAYYVLNGPFPKGEDAIAKNATSAYEYSRFVLHAPFPKGEDAIAKDSTFALNYAEFVLEKPFPKGEDAICQNANSAYLYARRVLNAPFPKGEDIISKDATSSYNYAVYVIKGPFPKGEPEIKKHSTVYAAYIESLNNL